MTCSTGSKSGDFALQGGSATVSTGSRTSVVCDRLITNGSGGATVSTGSRTLGRYARASGDFALQGWGAILSCSLNRVKIWRSCPTVRIETAWTWITIVGTTDDFALQGGRRAIDIQHSVVCARPIATGFGRDEGQVIAGIGTRMSVLPGPREGIAWEKSCA